MSEASLEQIPHGILDIQPHESSPWILVIIILLSVCLLAILLRLWRRKVYSKPAIAQTPAKQLDAFISEMQDDSFLKSRELADLVSKISLNLRGAIELVMDVRLTDMTYDEISEHLPLSWTASKCSVSDVLSLLRQCELILYRNDQVNLDQIIKLRSAVIEIILELKLCLQNT